MTPADKIREAYPDYAELIFQRTMECHGVSFDEWADPVSDRWRCASDLLLDAFVWDETPEGYDFWNNPYKSQSKSLFAENERLKAERDELIRAMELSRDILSRNLGHQTEKCYDAISLIKGALAKVKP